MEKRRGKDRGREGECWCPVFRAITHQTSPPSLSPPPSTLKKQNSVLTSRWRGAEGRAGREGGKLGNQMWSIKTYWHAEGLPLPHSHTESTNSYSRPRCMYVCMHMSHAGCTKPRTHPCMSSQRDTQRQILPCEQPCVHNQSCNIIHISKKWCLKNKCLKVMCLYVLADF